MKLSTLIETFGGTCFWCGKSVQPRKHQPHPDAPTRDHVVPRSRGGLGNAANTVLACYACNQTKSNLDFRHVPGAWLVLKRRLLRQTLTRLYAQELDDAIAQAMTSHDVPLSPPLTREGGHA